jgi:hypothetical protein
MEPFCENKEVPRYIKSTADQLQKEFNEYKNKIRTEAQINPGDDQSLKEIVNQAKSVLKAVNNFGNDTWTTKDFFKWYNDYEDSDFDEEGNVYSTYNPQSKWDWYEVGGRWKNSLILKNGKRADKAKIKDVYFHGHSERPIEYKDVVDAIRDNPHPILRYIETATAELGTEWDQAIDGKDFYKPEYYLRKYKTKENYIEQSLIFSTYAIITADGKWHAPGEMGWFGCSNETVEESNMFVDQYYETFIKNANPEHYIIIVDCHI